METALTQTEAQKLAQYETVIERGIATFVEVGIALLAVREERLWRSYGTFENYCNQRWGWTARRARQLTDSASVIQNIQLGTIVPNAKLQLPATESQARPLTALRDQPELQREVWREAVETAPGGKVTAAYVQAVVESHTKPTSMAHVGYSTGNNEWYTPDEYIQAAKIVMGGIDLDPASTEVANRVVGARKFYTADDDGLLYDWHGRVWMNPPYAQPAISRFCDRLRTEFDAQNVTEAIALVNNATETAWFQTLIFSASAVCFPLARVKFWSPDRIAAPLQGQAVVYLGKNEGLFLRSFAGFGWCALVTK